MKQISQGSVNNQNWCIGNSRNFAIGYWGAGLTQNIYQFSGCKKAESGLVLPFIFGRQVSNTEIQTGMIWYAQTGLPKGHFYLAEDCQHSYLNFFLQAFQMNRWRLRILWPFCFKADTPLFDSLLSLTMITLYRSFKKNLFDPLWSSMVYNFN